MTTPYHKNPCHRGLESYYFGRPFLGHYYILSLSDLCKGAEQIIFKKIMHFHLYVLYGHTLARVPLPRGS